MTPFETFANASRSNTGKHFLDSGDYYGRHWEKPQLFEDSLPVKVNVYRDSVYATIETAHLLAASLEPDQDIQSAFESWIEDRDGCWQELVEGFMESLGYVSQARDNVYNGENDLSQVYIWEVFSQETPSDWIYDCDAITVIQIHTGCDVRGGYAPPIFCRPLGDYSIPVELVAEYRIVESHYEVDGLDEKWSAGYSSYPTSEVERDIKRIFSHTVNGNTFIAQLTSGEVVRIAAEMPVY